MSVSVSSALARRQESRGDVTVKLTRLVSVLKLALLRKFERNKFARKCSRHNNELI